MQRIPLHVATDIKDSWNLTWNLPDWPDRHYHVDKTVLQETGRDVRTALQQMVDDARAKKPLGISLKQLAIAGAQLREAIFFGVGNDAREAAFVLGQLLGAGTDWKLLITLDERVYVPWGLAYDGDPALLPDNPLPSEITPELYAGFWCLKYNVCTLHSVVDPKGLLKPRSYDEVQMLRIINQGCWTAAENAIPPPEKTFFDSVWTRGQSAITSSDEFFKAWQSGRKDIDLLYLYCHANGTQLALSGTDVISTTNFRLKVRHEPDHTHPVCLVFLNGCQTAIGADKGGFMEATGNTGFCGFIGTEAKIPDLFACRFAADFFAYLFHGDMAVAEIMETLRKQHFPLSLVYSTCCHPLFQIKRIGPAPALPTRNLSQEPLQAAMLL